MLLLTFSWALLTPALPTSLCSMDFKSRSLSTCANNIGRPISTCDPKYRYSLFLSPQRAPYTTHLFDGFFSALCRRAIRETSPGAKHQIFSNGLENHFMCFVCVKCRSFFNYKGQRVCQVINDLISDPHIWRLQHQCRGAKA